MENERKTVFANIPESLKQVDITEAWGNRQEWRYNSVGESREVKKKARTPDNSEAVTGTTLGKEITV